MNEQNGCLRLSPSKAGCPSRLFRAFRIPVSSAKTATSMIFGRLRVVVGFGTLNDAEFGAFRGGLGRDAVVSDGGGPVLSACARPPSAPPGWRKLDQERDDAKDDERNEQMSGLVQQRPYEADSGKDQDSRQHDALAHRCPNLPRFRIRARIALTPLVPVPACA